MAAVTRKAKETRGREWKHAVARGEENRAGWKKTRRDEPRTPPYHGFVAVTGDGTRDLSYRAKQMLGILSAPEYAHVDDGFDDLVTPAVRNFAVQGKAFDDEDYAAQNFRSAAIRERETERQRDRETERESERETS